MELKDFNDWVESISYSEWMEWAKKPSETRKDRNNILPEIIDYLTEHPEDFNEPVQLIGGLPIAAPAVSPRTWVGASEHLVIHCLETRFGKRYDSIASMPKEEIIHQLAGTIGPEVSKKFADYITR